MERSLVSMMNDLPEAAAGLLGNGSEAFNLIVRVKELRHDDVPSCG